VRVLPGLDIRTTGGYIVLPGSVHESGREYVWEAELGIDEVELATIPEWLLQALTDAKPKTKAHDAIPDTIPEGARNDTLMRHAGGLRQRGMDETGILAELLELNTAKCIPPLPDTEVEAIAKSVSQYPVAVHHCLSDLSNAEAVIAAHGNNLRYDVNRGAWLVWNGFRWEYSTTGEVNRLSQDVVRSMYTLLPNLDRAAADAMYSHIKKSESAPRLAAMIDLARYLQGVPVQAADLDHDPMLMNVLNGTVDLRSGTLRPHTREDLITKLAPVEYDPAAQCPRWMQFLSEVFQGNADIVGFVKRMAGYCLTGDISEQTAFILSGKGANGKSTLVEVLCAAMGDYAANTPFSTFIEKRDSNTADLASLIGKRLVTACEGEEGASFNEGLLKTLTGGDKVTCRHLYHDFFSYTPTYKVLFSTNEIPRIKSQNYAMKRRIKLIPFRQRFYEPHEDKLPVKDPALIPKLLAEKNGILAWCVQGCLEWQASGLATPAVIRREVEALFESQDPLAEWLDSECELRPGEEEAVGDLWKNYLLWCEENGRKPAFKQVQGFSRSLQQRDGIDPKRVHGGLRTLTGIRLLNGGEPMDGETEDTEEDPFSESRVTRGDEKTHFSVKSPMKDLHGKVSEKAESSSPHAQSSSPEDTIGVESPPKKLPYNCRCGKEVTLALENNGKLYAYRCNACGNRGRVAPQDYEKLRIQQKR